MVEETFEPGMTVSLSIGALQDCSGSRAPRSQWPWVVRSSSDQASEGAPCCEEAGAANTQVKTAAQISNTHSDIEQGSAGVIH